MINRSTAKIPQTLPIISQSPLQICLSTTENGTEMICAPMVSLSFQPKPFCLP